MEADICTIMTDLRSLIRLQAWLSPAFPIGAFSYSHGLEAAIDSEFVSTKHELEEWLRQLLKSGPGWNDAVLLTESWRLTNSNKDLDDLAELAEAMAFSKERHLETMAQGEAFLTAAAAWNETASAHLNKKTALPVAIGAIAALYQVDLTSTVAAFLHAYISNQLQSALRLMKLGQQAAVELQVALESDLLAIASRAAATTLADLGAASFVADIASIQHETLQGRLFRA